MDSSAVADPFPIKHTINGVTYYDLASALGNEDIKQFFETQLGHKFRKSKQIPQELLDAYPGRLFVQHSQYYRLQNVYFERQPQPQTENVPTSVLDQSTAESSSAVKPIEPKSAARLSTETAADNLNYVNQEVIIHESDASLLTGLDVESESSHLADNLNYVNHEVIIDECDASLLTGLDTELESSHVADNFDASTPMDYVTAQSSAAVTVPQLSSSSTVAQNSLQNEFEIVQYDDTTSNTADGHPGKGSKRRKTNDDNNRSSSPNRLGVDFTDIGWAKDCIREKVDPFGFASDDESDKSGSSDIDADVRVSRMDETMGQNYLNKDITEISIGTQLDVEVQGIIESLKSSDGHWKDDGSFIPGSATAASIIRFAGQHLGIDQTKLTTIARLFKAAASGNNSVPLGNIHSTGRKIIQQNRRAFEQEAKTYE
jgi:hypothetical protein